MLKRWTVVVHASNTSSIKCLAISEARVKEGTVDETTNWKDRERCCIHEYIEQRRALGTECIHTSFQKEVSGEM